MKALRSIALRLWPYPIGFLICVLIGLAEREAKQAEIMGGMPLNEWLASRFQGPWLLATTQPAEGWLAWLLLALFPLHLIWPRWYLAPVAMGTLIAWVFWGSLLLGRMA